jgi:hypothetical protein
MKSATLPSFWDGYREQSDSVRQRARKAYIQKIPNDGTTTYKVSPLLPGSANVDNDIDPA